MARDPVRLEDTRSWLVKAAKDLRRAEFCSSPEIADAEDAFFHCQQAAEKALKAFLSWHDVPFRKTHDLGKLCGQCAEVDPAFGTLTERLAALTAYAWRFRYPGAPYEPTAEEAQEVLARAREAVEAVSSRLPAEARP